MALPPLDTGVSLPRCGFRILHALRTVMIGDYVVATATVGDGHLIDRIF